MKRLTREEEFELQELVKEGDVKALGNFLKKHPEVVHKDYEMLIRSCVGYALQNRDVDSLKLLVKAHPQMNFDADLLMQALSFKDLSLAKSMLEHGADPNAELHDDERGGKGGYSYHYLHEVNSAEAVKLLIAHGANPDAKDNNGKTALHTAGYSKAKALLENGATVDVKDEDGKTPLFDAVERGDMKTVKLLLDHGANVNAHAGNDDLSEFTGVTPLCEAIKNGDVKMVKLLLENGADVPRRYPKEAWCGTGLGAGEHLLNTPWGALSRYKRDHPDADVSEIEKLLYDHVKEEKDVNISDLIDKLKNMEVKSNDPSASIYKTLGENSDKRFMENNSATISDQEMLYVKVQDSVQKH